MYISGARSGSAGGQNGGLKDKEVDGPDTRYVSYALLLPSSLITQCVKGPWTLCGKTHDTSTPGVPISTFLRIPAHSEGRSRTEVHYEGVPSPVFLPWVGPPSDPGRVGVSKLESFRPPSPPPVATV